MSILNRDTDILNSRGKFYERKDFSKSLNKPFNYSNNENTKNIYYKIENSNEEKLNKFQNSHSFKIFFIKFIKMKE